MVKGASKIGQYIEYRQVHLIWKLGKALALAPSLQNRWLFSYSQVSPFTLGEWHFNKLDFMTPKTL